MKKNLLLGLVFLSSASAFANATQMVSILNSSQVKAKLTKIYANSVKIDYQGTLKCFPGINTYQVTVTKLDGSICTLDVSYGACGSDKANLEVSELSCSNQDESKDDN